MVDLTNDDLLTFTVAAKLLNIHVSSLHRWKQKGVRGHRLSTVRVGGGRRVSRRALEEFISTLRPT
jgi:excisionase family DNA binding protein